MLKIVSMATLALAGLAVAAPARAATGANDAACAYESLAAPDRDSLRAQTFERMMRGADQEAGAPSRAKIDNAIAGARAGCLQRHGWNPVLSRLSHEYASLSLARDAFRRMLAEQGLSSEPLDAYHRAHRAEFGRELTAPQQAAFTAELEARQWAANDPSDSAIDVAVGYLRILNDLEHCQGVFAVALAASQAKPIQTAAR
jgi:hypothetical protein